jgi:hypothetical protein
MKKQLRKTPGMDTRFNRYLAFYYGRVHGGYYGFVVRGVSLYPLTGWPRKLTANAIRGYSKFVVNHYRALLDAFHDAGKLLPVQMHQLGNCRPAFTEARPVTRSCDMVMLCPHCWARRAGEFWKRIDAALFPVLDGGDRAEAASLDLVSVTRRFDPLAVLAYRADGELPLVSLFGERLSDRTVPGPQKLGSRSLEMRRLRGRFEWAVEGLVVDLDYTNSIPYWSVEIRQLFAVRPGVDFDVPGAKVRRIETPSRREVARAVVRLCRYPRGLLLDPRRRLTPAPAMAVNKYQEVAAKRRLWATYGDLPAAGIAKGE